MATKTDTSVSSFASKVDPRLLDKIGRDYARLNGVLPLRRVGALTLVAARDMWARIETIDHLEANLGPVTFIAVDPESAGSLRL